MYYHNNISLKSDAGLTNLQKHTAGCVNFGQRLAAQTA